MKRYILIDLRNLYRDDRAKATDRMAAQGRHLCSVWTKGAFVGCIEVT